MRSTYLLPLLLILPAAAHPPTEPELKQLEALVVTGNAEGGEGKE